MSSDDDSDQLAEADDILSGMFVSLGNSLFDRREASLRPLSRIDVGQDEVTVTFDVPGVDKADVSVTCTEYSLGMEAEARKQSRVSGTGLQRSSVEFVRYSESVKLPVPVNPDGAKANFKNGIVVVKLPRAQTGKRIKLSGSRR
jgi:HSP20 family protein